MFPSLSVTDNVEKQVFPFRRLNLLLYGQAVQLLDKVLGCPLSGVYVGLGILMGQKSASSRLLKKEYPEIREKLWKEAFWSQSFCPLTAGGAPVEVIRQYIENQGEKKN